MIRHYFRTAITSLRKHMLFSVLNVAGLSVGLAACLLIGLFVLDETSYDSHWTRADTIHRVNYSVDNNGTGELAKFAFQPIVTLPLLEEYFADEFAHSARVYNLNQDVARGEEIFAQRVARVDPDFIEIFDLELLEGDLAATLADPSGIALGEAAAARIFGGDDALGQTLTLTYRGRASEHQVRAIYRAPEQNSVVDVQAFTLLDVSQLPPFLTTSWLNTGPELYVALNDGVDAAAVTDRMPAFIDRYADLSDLQLPPGIRPSDRMRFELQNIADIYLNSPWDTFHDTVGNKSAVYAFAAIAVLLLLVACLNFVTLTTARASARSREIAMRKTLGATRRQLFAQFIGETWALVLLALVIALVLVELALPAFNAFAGKQMHIDFGDPAVYVTGAALAFVVGLIGGIYPALLLSGFRPAQVLKSSPSRTDERTGGLRSAMVLFQFSISIALLIATFVIFAQIQLSLTRDIGFDRDNLLVMEMDEQLLPRADALKQQLLQLPNVENAALSYAHPPQATVGFYGVSYYLPETARARLEIRTSDIGEGFFETYGIELVAGRSYAAARDRELLENYEDEEGEFVERNLVINESAARYFGFASPQAALGQYVFMPDLGVDEREMRFTVVGVSADTQFFSLNAPPQPWIFHFAPIYTRFLTLRYTGDGDELLQQVGDVWRSVMGTAVLNTGFVDQYLAEELRQERLQGQVLASFSLLTIMIACLGLYGLAAFTVEQRTKEIGIRKVMGAAVGQIVTLLLLQFSRPILFANLVAWPLAAWTMVEWLQRFPYQIAIWLLIPFSLAAGILALIIAWLTVATHSVRVARTNPALALRYE